MIYKSVQLSLKANVWSVGELPMPGVITVYIHRFCPLNIRRWRRVCLGYVIQRSSRDVINCLPQINVNKITDCIKSRFKLDSNDDEKHATHRIAKSKCQNVSTKPRSNDFAVCNEHTQRRTLIKFTPQTNSECLIKEGRFVLITDAVVFIYRSAI